MRFIGFLGNADAAQQGSEHLARFLDDLAVGRKVSGSTQNLALNTQVFFYRETLGRSDLDIGSFVRAKRPRRLPTVLTHGEVTLLLQKLSGTQRLMAALMYGTGMRLMECSRLRVLDIDFGYGQITVRNAKGGKDRAVPLPEKAVEPLREHLTRVRELHQAGPGRRLRGGLPTPTPWHANTPMRRRSGAGSMCFPAGAFPPIHVREYCVAIICMKMACRKR